jgi:hypothetical protein
MKKFLVLAMAATLLMAGSAFAVTRSVSASSLLPRPELTFATGQPATTNNADSCDIGVTPAATLLLPYFEVDTAAAQGAGATTLFTITNTSRYPQIAHVTVWTDWSYPVLDFNIFLTGYDVQGINLFDVIVRGVIVPSVGSAPGTSITTVPGTAQNGFVGTGAVPFSNTSNPNFNLSSADVRANCANLPGNIQQDLALAIKNALTTGTGYVSSATSCGSGQIGFNHGTIAKGYVTVDVASYCSQQLPTDTNYYTGLSASILFDNTLIGDYQQIGPTPAGSGTASTFDAQGNPMVHIRAIPEGGLSGSSGGVPVATNLPFTFYDRYTGTVTPTADRRQPLPSLFAARYIQGGAGGFATNYKIWREGVTNNSLACSSSQYSVNSALLVTSIIRFDEHENSFGTTLSTCVSPCVPPTLTLPESSSTNTSSSTFPQLTGTDVGGWMFMNLSNQATSGTSAPAAVYTAQRVGFGSTGPAPPLRGSRTTSQNWVVVSMFGAVGANRLSVDFDAAWLGNGCSAGQPAGEQIAPVNERFGPLVCPVNTPSTNCGVGTDAPEVNP